jgi:hypothetical protein
MMNEHAFQQLWAQHAKEWSNLVTTEGDPVAIIHPGILNHDQGPDFKNAHIKIGSTEWFGNIELHLKTSDWYKHGHMDDPKYQNIILHVVWIHDHNSFNQSPVLEMLHFIGDERSDKELIFSINPLRCTNFSKKRATVHFSFLEQCVVTRFKRKVDQIFDRLKKTHGNIEQVAWELLARSFGYQANAECFESIARSIPFHLIRKYAGDTHTLEALLLGQAGLLPKTPQDLYVQFLLERYFDLIGKYNLQPIHCTPVFLRMRPVNFPTIRLVQLASLISNHYDLIEKLHTLHTIRDLKDLFSIHLTPYWLEHYIPDRLSKKTSKKIGTTLINSCIINVFIPLRLSLKKRRGEGDWKPEDLEWLRNLRPEHSKTIELFQKAGIAPSNGYESQAFLELYDQRCIKGNCKGCTFDTN